MRPQSKNILTHVVDRLLDSLGDTIGNRVPFDASPQLIHRVQLRGGGGQEPQFQSQVAGEFPTFFCGMGRTPILKEYDLPPAPMGTDHPQEGLVGFLHPFLGNQQQHIAAAYIEYAMEDALGAIAGDRHADLGADAPIAGIERRGLGNDGLVEHQEHRARACGQAAFEPPLAWRQVGQRRAS